MTAPKTRQRLQKIKDRRSAWARRHRQLAECFAADLGANLTEIDRTLVDHAATVALECEQMKAAQLNDDDVNLEQLVRLTNALNRVRRELIASAATKTDPRSMTFEQRMALFEKQNAERKADDGRDDDIDIGI